VISARLASTEKIELHSKGAPMRHLRAVHVAWIAVVLALCCATAALASAGGSASTRPSLAGSWTGSYDGAFKGTFTLTWKLTRSRLHGSIVLSRPKGSYSVSGSVKGSAINFGVVGAGATYTGSVGRSGKSMSGSYMTPRGGGHWSAHKT
jgi:hypothetical protein